MRHAGRPLGIAIAIAVALAIAAAALIPTSAYAGFFAGGGDEGADAALLQQGALLLRWMLVASGAALAAAFLLLARLARGTEGGPPDAPQRRGDLWWLAGLLVLGLLARAPRLAESLWYDEIAAWRQFGARGPGFIVGHYFDPANHVAHTLATWASVAALEPALGPELALRVPALLCSLASIAVIGGLARLAGGPRAGLVAAGLAAVLPVSVLEGVEARGYSMMILLSAASTLAWCRGWLRPAPGTWLAYAAVTALAVWAHPMAVFVPLGHAAWLIAAAPRGGARRSVAALAGLGLAGVVAAALYAPVLPQMLQMREGLAAVAAAQPRLLGPEGWHALLQLGGAWTWWAAAPGWALIAAAGLGAARASRSPVGAAPAPRVVWPALAGLPIFVAAVLVGGTWVYARFALFALPAAVVMIALGVERLRANRPAWAALGVAALVIAAAADLTLRPPKQPLRDAAEWVEVRTAPGEPVVVVGLAHRVLDVYAGSMDLRYSLRHGADLAPRLDEARPHWVIGYYPRHIGPAAHEALASRGYAPAQRFTGWVDWDNGDVLVWERAGAHHGAAASTDSAQSGQELHHGGTESTESAQSLSLRRDELMRAGAHHGGTESTESAQSVAHCRDELMRRARTDSLSARSVSSVPLW